jgi:hypothetical protein
LYGFVGNDGVDEMDILGLANENNNADVELVATSLKALCNKDCLGKCGCSKAECETEAANIAKVYVDIVKEAAVPDANRGDLHAGYLCYEWARKVFDHLISEIGKLKCFKFAKVGTVIEREGSKDGVGSALTHNYAWVSLEPAEGKNGPNKGCGAILDPWQSFGKPTCYPGGGQSVNSIHDWDFIEENVLGGKWWNPDSKKWQPWRKDRHAR